MSSKILLQDIKIDNGSWLDFERQTCTDTNSRRRVIAKRIVQRFVAGQDCASNAWMRGLHSLFRVRVVVL